MMNTQMQYGPGQMVEYKATRDFGMGGMNIQRGMAIHYDGYNISVAGRQQPLPGFKGALKAGWAVLSSEFDPNGSAQAPRSAGIKVHPANTGNPLVRQAAAMATVVEDEEQVVGNVQTHAQDVRAANQRRSKVASGVEPQDGVIVRTLSSPNSKDGARTTLTGSNVQQLIREASDVQIEAGRGVTREEVLARMSPEQRSQYLAEIEAKKSAYVDSQASVIQVGDAAQGTIVGHVGQPGVVESAGFRTTTTVGGGADIVDLSGMDSPAPAPEVIEAEGMKFTVTAPPKKPGSVPRAQLQDVDPRRVIAKAICGDFPDLYDFEAPIRKKIARIQADFEDRPDVIRAVAAAETDGAMKARLIEEFPAAFGA
jgi:hypothetical protein